MADATDKDREAAAAIINEWWTGKPTPTLEQRIAAAIAQAREEGRREERERCIRAMCWRCDHEAKFGTYQTVHNLNGWVHCEGMHYRWSCDANKLRDGQESWMRAAAIRARGED